MAGASTFGLGNGVGELLSSRIAQFELVDWFEGAFIERDLVARAAAPAVAKGLLRKLS